MRPTSAALRSRGRIRWSGCRIAAAPRMAARGRARGKDMHKKMDDIGDGTPPDGEFTRRSLGIMLSQTRASAVALTLAGLLYGLVIVPHAGWLPWLGWYVALVGAL